MLVKISEINVKSRLRGVVEETVQELIGSFKRVGQLEPIRVNRDYTLIYGLHRLEAARAIGWTTIECEIGDFDAIDAEIAEIDENLVRAPLSNSEKGELLLRRKELYEAAHPETRSGIAQCAGMKRAMDTPVSCTMQPTAKPFIDDTAEKVGVNRSTISRQIQAAKNTTPEAKKILKDGGIELTQKDAIALSRLKTKQQIEAAQQLRSGLIKKMAEYRQEDEEAVSNPTSASTSPGSEPSGWTKPPSVVDAKSDAPPLTMDERVANLKDMDKECSCSPETFLVEFSLFASKFCGEIEGYAIPFYDDVFPAMTPENLTDLRRQLDSIKAASDKFYKYVKGMNRK